LRGGGGGVLRKGVLDRPTSMGGTNIKSERNGDAGSLTIRSRQRGLSRRKIRTFKGCGGLGFSRVSKGVTMTPPLVR